MSYHFIGIGGIGMSSLAKILLQKKAKVKGSDLKANELIKALKKKGAKIYSDHNQNNLKEEDVVVYSSAITEENEELQSARKKNLILFHRSYLLKILMDEQFPILVTGTHGKTTVSALLTHVLLEANLDPSYALGGVLKSNNTNANLGKGHYFIAEADESDGSFLKYEAGAAIITNIEKEHLHFWKNIDRLKEGFLRFIENMERRDLLIWCKDDPILKEINPSPYSYGFSKEALVFADNLKEENFSLTFDIIFQKEKYKNIKLNLLGKHNVLNALAVFLLAKKLGVKENTIFKAFASFQGVKRRMDKIKEVNSVAFFDDYAHHPSEIKATLQALRQGVKEKRIIAVFQPHRFSRTEELFEEFCSCFQEADKVLITDIYSAGEKNESEISALKLAEKSSKDTLYVEKNKLTKTLLNIIKPHDTVIFLGAGDITKLGKDVVKAYEKKPNKLKIALLFGGQSVEHEVSKMSAKSVFNKLDPSLYEIKLFYISLEGKWRETDANFQPLEEKKEEYFSSALFEKLKDTDVAIPIFHGPKGEDGMLQGFFDTLQLAYVGCSYAASSCSMNKAWVKYIAQAHGIKTPKFIELKKDLWQENKEEEIKKIKEGFLLPFFIKSSHLGSSVGVKRMESFENLEEEIEEIFNFFDDSLIIEEGVLGQEVEVAVLGNRFVQAAIPGEVLASGNFYDYERKYGKEPFLTIVPANISEDSLEEVKEIAIKLYKLVGCMGMARVDFFYKDKELFVNEINPIPGFTSISLYPQMWEKSGVKYQELLDKLIVLAMHKKRVAL